MKSTLLIFVLLLTGCDYGSASKWRQDMPDDGTMLCSAAGEGFRVTNSPFGFGLDRHHEFDSECAKRVK